MGQGGALGYYFFAGTERDKLIKEYSTIIAKRANGDYQGEQLDFINNTYGFLWTVAVQLGRPMPYIRVSKFHGTTHLGDAVPGRYGLISQHAVTFETAVIELPDSIDPRKLRVVRVEYWELASGALSLDHHGKPAHVLAALGHESQRRDGHLDE